MTFLEALMWFAIAWAVFFGYCASDLPSLLSRLIHRHHGGRS
ncbi:hypothetical protein [Streptomyces coelicoflavus]|nr:hypothetical protein [Streptomyces coelicoflavus]